MVSPRNTTSALNLIPEEEKLIPSAKKSCESLCSQSSSKSSAQMLYRGKRTMFGGRQRQPGHIPATNEVRQRVLSARRLRMKTFQNQLADAQQTITELAHENRILRTLHKRQDSALAKYESTNAELPQLLHSHAEELRVWQTKYRNLQAINKELEQKIKHKEALILSLSDQNKYYIQLNKDKNLEDRQRLTEKVQALESRLQEKENNIKLMARKLQLEGKQFKHQLQTEQNKNKAILLKLEQARLELSGFRKLEDLHIQERFNMQMRRNKASTGEQQSKKANDDKSSEKNPFADLETADETEEGGSQSQRSQQSINDLSQRTAATIKKVSHLSNASVGKVGNSSSGISSIMRESSVKGTNLTPRKPTAIMRRIERGDGDAPSTVYKIPKSTTKQHITGPLSSLNVPQPETMKNCYEDGSSYNENSDYVTDHEAPPDSMDEATDENIHTLNRASQNNEKNDNAREDEDDDDDDDDDDDGDSVGGFMANIDDDENNVEEITELCEELENAELAATNSKTRMKEEISTIRKKISSDYKEREAFLDTFCRQASTGITREEITTNATTINSKKRSNHAIKEPTVASSRKNKLLAALKAIDNNKN